MMAHTQLSDVIDRQQNLEKTNMKLREGTHEVTFLNSMLILLIDNNHQGSVSIYLKTGENATAGVQLLRGQIQSSSVNQAKLSILSHMLFNLS